MPTPGARRDAGHSSRGQSGSWRGQTSGRQGGMGGVRASGPPLDISIMSLGQSPPRKNAPQGDKTSGSNAITAKDGSRNERKNMIIENLFRYPENNDSNEFTPKLTL